MPRVERFAVVPSGSPPPRHDRTGVPAAHPLLLRKDLHKVQRPSIADAIGLVLLRVSRIAVVSAEEEMAVVVEVSVSSVDAHLDRGTNWTRVGKHLPQLNSGGGGGGRGGRKGETVSMYVRTAMQKY